MGSGMSDPLAGLFDGLTVLEIGQYVAAPIAAELFAHGGANVIKIEPVTGDVTRMTDPIQIGEGRQYVIKARGKRALPLNLSTDEGRRVAADLALKSDVLITNMRPGTADRLGLGFEQLHKLHPTLIYGEINGFGDAGPNAGRPSLDLIAQSWTGLRAAAGIGEDGELGRYEAYFCDYTAGLLLAFGVAAALHHRNVTGLGQRVGTSLAHAALFMQHRNANLFESADAWKREVGAGVTDRMSFNELARYRSERASPDLFLMSTYKTSDGALSIGAPGAMSSKLCPLFEVEDPRQSPDWADRSKRSEALRTVKAEIAAKLATMTTAEAHALIEDASLPSSPVRMLEEMLVDQDAIDGGLLYEADHPRLGRYIMPTAPISMSGSDYRARVDTAEFGVHTDELLAELGYDAALIERLVADGIVARKIEREEKERKE